MTGIVGAARYPQPRALSTVLAEQQAGYCEHGGVPARCPSCRAAADLPDNQETPEPPKPRPPRRRAAAQPKNDAEPADGRLW